MSTVYLTRPHLPTSTKVKLQTEPCQSTCRPEWTLTSGSTNVYRRGHFIIVHQSEKYTVEISGVSPIEFVIHLRPSKDSGLTSFTMLQLRPHETIDFVRGLSSLSLFWGVSYTLVTIIKGFRRCSSMVFK